LERHRDDETYHRLGIRLITVDRPGHGLSSEHPGRTPIDFAEDLEELLDALDLEAVPALGFSAGGLYALTLAFRHPERVSTIGIVSGIGIIDRQGGKDGLTPTFKRLYHNSRHRPWLARTEMRLNMAAFRHRPAYAFKQLSDRKITATPAFERLFLEALLEGARQGVHGFVEDTAVNTGPWGFDPTDIDAPIRWWHGDKDRASPISHAHYVIERLPNARLETITGAGHFMIHSRIEEILSALSQHQTSLPSAWSAKTGAPSASTAKVGVRSCRKHDQ
jgi:pimeloyl-ACP methyl ester carboxylesterase